MIYVLLSQLDKIRCKNKSQKQRDRVLQSQLFLSLDCEKKFMEKDLLIYEKLSRSFSFENVHICIKFVDFNFKLIKYLIFIMQCVIFFLLNWKNLSL